jgi:surfeit locus 1 family protein
VAAGLLMLALLLTLGFWQLDRAAQKRELQAAYAEASMATPLAVETAGAIATLPRYTQVLLRGAFGSSRQGLLDAQDHQGRSGYRVWTPFILDDGGVVLVDRGWVPANPDRDQLPTLGVDSGARTLIGIVAPLPRAGIVLGAPESRGNDWPRRMLWPDADAVAANWGTGVPARIVLLRADQEDGFVREWTPATGMPPERHLGYAVQWFGLAAALVVIWLVVVRRTRGKRDGQA